MPAVASAADSRQLSTRRARSSQTRARKAKKFDIELLVALVVRVARSGGQHRGQRRLLAKQKVVEHRTGNRRGSLRAEAAVLDEHRHGDLRMVRWGIRDVPRVVAQALVDVSGNVFFTFERIQLRR